MVNHDLRGWLTAVVDDNVSGQVLHKAVVHRRCRVEGRRGSEGVAEEVDGVALEAGPDVGIHRRGHADVGVAQQFLDHDELDALLQEEGGRRVPQIVDADADAAEQGVEVPGVSGSFDRGAVGPGEDVAARLPARARLFAFLALPVVVLSEGAQALDGQGDPPLRALGLGGQSTSPLAA